MKRFLIIIGVLSALACGWLLFAKSLIPSADEFIADFHRYYNEGDFGYIYDRMTNRYFKQAVSREPVLKYLSDAYDRLGKATAVKKGRWGLFYKNVGLVLNIEYNTEFERGKAGEYFELVKNGPSWSILLYDLKGQKAEVQ